jgi:hypothetical protein
VGGAGPPVDAGLREATALVLHDEAVHGAGRPTVRLRLQQQVRPAQRGGEVIDKEVKPSTTLAWPGWKQPDIPVEVDTARLETSRFKNGFAKCLLLYYPSSEFKSVVNVY